MKKIFLALIVLIASSVNALATTVTVSAYQLQNLPFNPSNVGSDRSITVSATNGSATVTSSAQFPSNIVGIGGFQVAIGGTQYVVSSVASTSTLILTTNYAGITGSATMTLYKYVLLRAYATAGFQDNVTGQNIQPGTPGSGQFYKQVAVSIINSGSGNVAYMPEFTIPSTTDALINNQARYVFGFYRTDGSLLSFYLCGSVQQLALQPNTPTTWTAICNFNSPNGVVPPNNDVYTAAQIDQRFPNCSSGQLYYFASNGNIVSCLSLGTNLSITAGTLNASGGGGGGSIGAGVAGNLAGYSAPGTSLVAFTVGAQLTTSGTTLKGQNLAGALNVVVDYGCAGDGVTNDTVCISNALTAAALSGSKKVYLPGGNYRVTGLTINGPIEVYGDGRKTIISSVTNAPIIAAGQTGGTFYGPNIHDLQITGSVTAGSSQTGITITDGTYVYRANLENLYITDTGSHALSTGNVFSSSFTNITLNNSAGYPLYYNSANMPGNRFESIYVELLRASAPTGFYIRQGDFSCYRCNGINNSISGSRWARVGEQIGVDGGTADASGSLNCDSCNVESFNLDGIKAYMSSSVTLRGASGIGGAGVNANQTALTFLKNPAAFSASVAKGYIEDTVIIADGLAPYKNSQPIHSDDTPPIMTNGFGPQVSGSGQLGTYYDDTLTAEMPLERADGMAKKFSVTATTSIPRIGIRYIETNCAAPCTVTIPWGGWYQYANDQLTIVDVGSTPSNVTIQADSGGLINGAANYAFSITRQSIILRPDGDSGSGSWRIVGGNNQTAVTSSQVAFGNASNVITSSSTLTYDNSLKIFTLTGTNNPHHLVTDSSATITVRMGTLSGAPDRGIIGTTSNDPFVLYANGNGAWGVDNSTLAWLPYQSSNTIDIGSSTAYVRSGYFQTSLLVGHSSSTSGLINLRNSAGSDTITITSGAATPEGAITAGPGSQYYRTNGTWYIKSTGTGNTGWTLVSTGGLAGSGSTGAIAKFTAANAIGDSILAEIAGVLTTTGTQVISGKTISTDATGTVASLTSAATFTKNDVNSRTFDVVRIKPTFNFGGANASTTVNLLSIDSTNTAVTGTIFNLINAQYGGATKWSVDSTGAITFATGVRQAFAPSASVASLNFGQIGSDPSAPVNGDCVYNTGSNKFRCYENGGWANMISGGTGTVNSGTQYQLGYYATTAAALSGNSGITTSATNTLTIAPTAASSGTAPVAFQVTGAAHTGLSASSEVVDINFALNRTVQRAAGGVTTDRSVRFQGRTVSFVSASTVTNEYNVEIESNTAGTNATLTASTALHTFPSVTTHHGIFADHQVGATGDSLRVGLSGSPIVRFNASGGTINSVFNANGALSTSATDGFQYISQIDSATNPTGVPTSYSGSSAIVLQNNTTNAQYVMKSYLNSGWRDLSQSLGHTTPAQITATQNNYNPGAVTRLQRWSSDTSRQVTGLTFTPTQMSGQEHIICNVGTNDIVLVHESASSTSTNRFATTGVANITIVGESCATVIYDGVTQRWRAWVNP